MSKRRRKRIKLGTVLIVFFLLWLGYTFGKGIVRNYQLKQKISQLSNEIRAFELRNAEIRRQIELHRSYEYIEQVAREELGLVKPGETRFIISESQDE